MASVSGILIKKRDPFPSVDCKSTVPPIFSMFVLTTSMPTAARHGRHTRCRRKARLEDELHNLLVAHRRRFGFGGQTVHQGLGLNLLQRKSSAVIGYFDYNVTAFMIGIKNDDPGFRLARHRPAVCPGFQCRDPPSCAHVRQRILDSSRTCRSVPYRRLPFANLSFCPTPTERSRTTRGNFDQALPIGCMRVFITPS